MLAVWLPFYSLQLSIRRRCGGKGRTQGLALSRDSSPGLSVVIFLANSQPVLLRNSVLLPTLFPFQRLFHLSWSTRRRSRASSHDTPISPSMCLVLMAATATCSAHAKLTEGTDP